MLAGYEIHMRLNCIFLRKYFDTCRVFLLAYNVEIYFSSSAFMEPFYLLSWDYFKIISFGVWRILQLLDRGVDLSAQ